MTRPFAIGCRAKWPYTYTRRTAMLEGVSDRDYDGGLGLVQAAAGVQRLDADEAIQLLAGVEFGRIVFTVNALPAIRPVNHLLDKRRIIIRTRLITAISSVARNTDGVVVAYEADSIDPATRSGWSVVVTGRARTVTDPDEVSRYEQLLHPWAYHAQTVIAIDPGFITGFRIAADSR